MEQATRLRYKRHYDSDIRKFLIGVGVLIALCATMTIVNLWEHNWIYAFTTLIWTLTAFASRHSAQIEQGTRDDFRQWRNHL